MSLTLGSLVLCSVMVACGRPPLPEPNFARASRPTCETPTSDTYYFEQGALVPEHAESDGVNRRALGLRLRLGGFTSLTCGHDSLTAYRLTWLGSHVGELVAEVRRLGAGSWSARGVRFSRTTYGAPVSVSKRWSAAVAPETMAQLLVAIERAGLWNQDFGPYGVWSSEDGSSWTIEARRNNSVRVVSVANGRSDEFRAAARALVAASGITPPPEMR